MSLNLLLHLYLLRMAFLLVEFGPKTVEFLGILGLLVRLSRDSFASPFFVVEPMSPSTKDLRK